MHPLKGISEFGRFGVEMLHLLQGSHGLGSAAPWLRRLALASGDVEPNVVDGQDTEAVDHAIGQPVELILG